MQHYHHSVASEAKKLEQPLPKLESDLAAQLDTNVDDVGIVGCHLLSYYMHLGPLCDTSVEGGNAVLMRTSSESEVFVPDILGHQPVGSMSLCAGHLLV